MNLTIYMYSKPKRYVYTSWSWETLPHTFLWHKYFLLQRIPRYFLLQRIPRWPLSANSPCTNVNPFVQLCIACLSHNYCTFQTYEFCSVDSSTWMDYRKPFTWIPLSYWLSDDNELTVLSRAWDHIPSDNTLCLTLMSYILRTFTLRHKAKIFLFIYRTIGSITKIQWNIQLQY